VVPWTPNPSPHPAYGTTIGSSVSAALVANRQTGKQPDHATCVAIGRIVDDVVPPRELERVVVVDRVVVLVGGWVEHDRAGVTVADRPIGPGVRLHAHAFTMRRGSPIGPGVRLDTHAFTRCRGSPIGPGVRLDTHAFTRCRGSPIGPGVRLHTYAFACSEAPRSVCWWVVCEASRRLGSGRGGTVGVGRPGVQTRVTRVD